MLDKIVQGLEPSRTLPGSCNWRAGTHRGEAAKADAIKVQQLKQTQLVSATALCRELPGARQIAHIG